MITETVQQLLTDKANLEKALRVVNGKLSKLIDVRPRHDLARLKPAVVAGLFNNEPLGNTVREFSKPWRRLLNDLALPIDAPNRIEAEAILLSLGVNYTKAGTNGRKFLTF